MSNENCLRIPFNVTMNSLDAYTNVICCVTPIIFKLIAKHSFFPKKTIGLYINASHCKYTRNWSTRVQLEITTINNSSCDNIIFKNILNHYNCTMLCTTITDLPDLLTVTGNINIYPTFDLPITHTIPTLCFEFEQYINLNKDAIMQIYPNIYMKIIAEKHGLYIGFRNSDDATTKPTVIGFLISLLDPADNIWKESYYNYVTFNNVLYDWGSGQIQRFIYRTPPYYIPDKPIPEIKIKVKFNIYSIDTDESHVIGNNCTDVIKCDPFADDSICIEI